MKIYLILVLSLLVFSIAYSYGMEGYDYYTYINHTDTDMKLKWDTPENTIAGDYYEVRRYDFGKKAYKALGDTTETLLPVNFSTVGLYVFEVRTCGERTDDTTGEKVIKCSEWAKGTAETNPKPWWINIFRKPPGSLFFN